MKKHLRNGAYALYTNVRSMKKIFLALLFFGGISLSIAQPYVVVNQTCASCGGCGVVYTYYGPMYCPSCGGTGVVQVTVPNPYYNQPSSQPTFKSENSDGYVYKGEIYLTRVSSKLKDEFKHYVKDYAHYVKYKSTYYKLSGKKFVKINNIDYYTGY